MDFSFPMARIVMVSRRCCSRRPPSEDCPITALFAPLTFMILSVQRYDYFEIREWWETLLRTPTNRHRGAFSEDVVDEYLR